MVPQGNLTGEQMRGLAKLSEDAGEGTLRVSMSQNVMFAYVPVGALPRVYGVLQKLGLANGRADEISDVVTCPGAYSCNLALTKSMGWATRWPTQFVSTTTQASRDLKIRISGCPNSCGQHWIGDLGFYGNARKIGEGKEVPYYMMMLGGTEEEFGLSVQSMPARLVPAAVDRVLNHFIENRQAEEKFRDYVKRNKVETFKKLTADLAVKPTVDAPDEIFKDWGDAEKFSLQLGRGECAA